MIETKVTKWGNSQGIRIPKKVLSEIGINNPVDQKVDINVEKDKIVIHKHTGKSKFAQRFEGFDLNKYNKQVRDSREYDWGEDVGNEQF